MSFTFNLVPPPADEHAALIHTVDSHESLTSVARRRIPGTNLAPIPVGLNRTTPPARDADFLINSVHSPAIDANAEVVKQKLFKSVTDTDATLLCFTDIRLRRSTWIILANLLCFCIHITWAILCLLAGRGKEDDLTFQVHRLHTSFNRSVIANERYQFDVVPNGRPLRLDLLAAGFFGLSAIAHGGLVLLACTGYVKRLRWWAQTLLWDNIDLAFAWWRWLEYSISAPLMLLSIAVVFGMREQNALASIFLLQWVTIVFGFLTELYSHPLETKLEWLGDRDKNDEYTGQSKQVNYARRMIPHVFGIFTYVACWVLILNSWFESLDDVREHSPDIYDAMPRFVYAIVIGTVVIFSLFSVVQIRYQWLPPSRFWESEIWYYALSATAKVFLGALLYINVLTADRTFN